MAERVISSAPEPIVFVDRDGTISIDHGYTVNPEDLKIFPGAGLALGALKRAGFLVVIVTNQSAIGRGMATREQVDSTNRECLSQLLAEDPDATVDLVCLCPHAPNQDCDCRKPKPGMVVNPEFPFVFKPESCWMIGDKLIDIEFGLALGLPATNCLMVFSGEGKEGAPELASPELANIGKFTGLCAAAEFIVKNLTAANTKINASLP